MEREIENIDNILSIRPDEVVSWRAKEYVVEKRDARWYIAVLIISLILMGIAVWLKYWSFVLLVAVSVVALFVYINRPARDLNYKLDKNGLLEDNKKMYNYANFKAFSVVQDGNNFSIVLMPKQRFSLPVRVYFPQEQGEKIVDMFGIKLPMKEYKEDLLDKMVKFLRI